MKMDDMTNNIADYFPLINEVTERPDRPYFFTIAAKLRPIPVRRPTNFKCMWPPDK